ncbi:MAG: DinB family protein [Chloroflexi bacterium]|nr:DinB family protein [Chloroflexota bacterium]
MVKCKLAGLLLDTWKDLDRVLRGLEPAQAVQQLQGGSSFAWTLGHLSSQVDSWINVRLQGRSAHTLLGHEQFRFGGTGQADEWEAILHATQQVRDAARPCLENLEEKDLERVFPYDGPFRRFQETGVTLRYVLTRACVHHYFHIGEIATKRNILGHQVGDYPGPLYECA